MKTFVTTAIVVAGLGIAGPHRQTSIKPVKGFERFQEWSQLVWAHVPGEIDDSLRAIEGWPAYDLSATRVDLGAIVQFLGTDPTPGAMFQYTTSGRVIRPTEMARPESRTRSIKIEEVSHLLGLTTGRGNEVFSEAELNRFMKRAAMFHTDVVMLSTGSASAPAPRAEDLRSTTRRVVDGRDAGWDARPIHWEFGRTALDGVRPAPGADRLVAAWYRATAAYLLFRREYGYVVPHLMKGRLLFPKDAHLQLYSGVVHEAHAAPVVQAALQVLSSRTFTPDVESPAAELTRAEAFLRRAVDLEPGLGTARVRLSRVLGLLGRHAEAAGELRRALSSLADARQRYCGELFLGAEELAAGHATEAKAAFQRASALFPNAQSPYLALGQLAWQQADRRGAEFFVEGLAGLPRDQASREDPWWSYDVSAVRDFDVLVQHLRELAAAEQVRK